MTLPAEAEPTTPPRPRRESTQLAPGIYSTPGVCGGDPCVGRTRIPVWSLQNSRRLGIGDEDLLRDYPSLTSADLDNAWRYAEAHADETDRLIRLNEEGFAEDEGP